jgi:hypothetical protein
MRRANLFLSFVALSLIFVSLMFLHACLREKAALSHFRDGEEMVRKLGLTDLCLFTEASYTRHLTRTDRHTPFQDYPMSPDYFPSGSIVTPPEMVKKR